jgi:hypothetical protein
MEEIAIPITSEFKEITREIVNKNLSETEWSAIEGDDMFQSNYFEGGFDATENAFTFSFFINEKEYWVQLTLDEIKKINAGQMLTLKGTLADTFI